MRLGGGLQQCAAGREATRCRQHWVTHHWIKSQQHDHSLCACPWQQHSARLKGALGCLSCNGSSRALVLMQCALLLPCVTSLRRRGHSILSLSLTHPLTHPFTHFVCHCVSAAGTVKLPAGYNPATWMLEVTGGAMATLIPANTAVDWPEHYLTSSLALGNARQAEMLVQEVCEPQALEVCYGHICGGLLLL